MNTRSCSAAASTSGRASCYHQQTRVVGLAVIRQVWTRPTPDRDADFIKPSYVPQPIQTPVFEPRREETFFRPALPEFKPSELPDKATELPQGPAMPARPRDPIPAGKPKERPAEEQPEKREAPPAKEVDPSTSTDS